MFENRLKELREERGLNMKQTAFRPTFDHKICTTVQHRFCANIQNLLANQLFIVKYLTCK